MRRDVLAGRNRRSRGVPRVVARRVAAAVAAALMGLSASALSAPAGAQAPEVAALPPAPGLPGWRLATEDGIAPGVVHRALAAEAEPQAVHVARIDPGAEVDLRVVPAGGVGPATAARERTTGLCARVGCLLAVNGDFFDPATGIPRGGLIIDGEVVRSPVAGHHQLMWNDQGWMTVGDVTLAGRLATTDLREITFSTVNVPRPPDGVTLYTPAWGPSTGTRGGVEIAFEIVEGSGPLRLESTYVVRMAARDDDGDIAIPADGFVLSGDGVGAIALATAWDRAATGLSSDRALLRLEASLPVRHAVGGAPVLVSGGEVVVPDDPTGFLRGRHPRTAVGRTADGAVLLVTVDGRQPGAASGVTARELAELMVAMGATDAINLDGGGSTTFVVGGRVANRPSDTLVQTAEGLRVMTHPEPGLPVVGNLERPVASALAVVARTGPVPPPAPATPLGELSAALLSLPVPPSVTSAAPPAPDPASDPTDTSPAVVETPDLLAAARLVAPSAAPAAPGGPAGPPPVAVVVAVAALVAAAATQGGWVGATVVRRRLAVAPVTPATPPTPGVVGPGVAPGPGRAGPPGAAGDRRRRLVAGPPVPPGAPGRRLRPAPR